MDRSQAGTDEQNANQKLFTEAEGPPEGMARIDVLAREHEVVDLQDGANDFFIEQERELREGGYR